MMSTKAREQMKRDATFLYEGQYRIGINDPNNPTKIQQDKSLIVNKALERDFEELNSRKQYLSNLEAQYIITPNNSPQKAEYNRLIESTKANITDYEKKLANSRSNYENMFDSNKDELFYKAFSDDYFRGLGKRYSLYQETQSVGIDPVEKAIKEFEIRDREFREKTRLAEARLKNDRDIAAFKEGQLSYDPATGNFTAPNTGGGGGGVIAPTMADATDATDDQITKMKENVTNLLGQRESTIKTYIEGLISSAGLTDFAFDANINKDDRVDENDFSDWAKLSNTVTQAYQSSDKFKNLTVDQKNAINDKYYNVLTKLHSAFANFSMKTVGSNKEVSNTPLPEGAEELMEKLFLIDTKTKALETNLSRTNEYVTENKKISGLTVGAGLNSMIFGDTKEVLTRKDAPKVMADQYTARTFREEDDKRFGTVKTNLRIKHSGHLPQKDDDYYIASINQEIGGTFNVGIKRKDKTEIKYIQGVTDPSIVNGLGIVPSEYDYLNTLVYYDQPLKNIPAYNRTKNFSILYDIYKVNSSNTDNTVGVRIKLDKGDVVITGIAGKKFTSPAEAYQAIRRQVQSNSTMTKEQFIEALKQAQN